jgi:hypothetical protein
MLPPPATSPAGQSGTNDASFVFTGTVQRLNDTTMSHLPTNELAAVVRVDEVIQGPDILQQIGGEEVTVYADALDLQPGEQATFYTQGITFGESIAVHAKEIRPAGVGAVAAAEAAVDPAANLRAQRAEERFTSADLVVFGRVTAIVDATPPAVMGATALDEDDTGPGISEHEPLWKKAIVEVQEVHKGNPGPGETVEIQFPASTDVMWYRAPKFQPGQEGVFMLHKDEPKAEASVMAAVFEEERPFTALDPADFQPADNPHIIQSVFTKLGTIV